MSSARNSKRFPGKLVLTGDSAEAGLSRDQPLELLSKQGMLDVLGYPYSQRFHEDAESRSIADLRFQAPTDILMIGFKKRGELPANLRDLHDQLKEHGHKAELIQARATETWWLNETGEFVREEDSEFTREALRHTTSWIDKVIASGERSI